MLKNEELRIEIIQLYYNMLVARYKGRQKMTELIIRNYQQPRITRDICYESRLKRLSQETTLVLSNTRELDRVPKTK